MCEPLDHEILLKAYDALLQERQKYEKYKLIYDTIKGFTENTSLLNDNLKRKIQNKMLMLECPPTTFVQPVCEDINHKEKYELVYELKEKLQEVLMEKLISNKNYPLEGTDIELVEVSRQLAVQRQNYVQNLLEQHKVLCEISEMRINKFPKLVVNQIQKCKALDTINHLKANLTQQKFKFDLFHDASKSMQPFKKLLQQIREQQAEFSEDITQLEMQKQKYKMVSSKQYDEILSKYLQYKASIEKKKALYELVNQ